MARKPRQLPAPLAAGPASAPSTGSIPAHPVPPDAATLRDRERYVLNLVLAGAPSLQIEQLASAPPKYDGPTRVAGGLGLSKGAIRQLIRDVRSLLLEDSPASIASMKAEMSARLFNDLLQMRSEKKRPHSAINAHEKLLAELHGLLAPRRVAIEVSAIPDALAQVVAGMTDASVEEQLLEERERDRVLRSITTTGEASANP